MAGVVPAGRVAGPFSAWAVVALGRCRARGSRESWVLPFPRLEEQTLHGPPKATTGEVSQAGPGPPQHKRWKATSKKAETALSSLPRYQVKVTLTNSAFSTTFWPGPHLCNTVTRSVDRTAVTVQTSPDKLATSPPRAHGLRTQLCQDYSWRTPGCQVPDPHTGIHLSKGTSE